MPALRLAAFLFGLLASSAAFAGGEEPRDEGPYPVWWSPKLELESLDKIDERLARPFGPPAHTFRMERERADGSWLVIKVGSCRDLLEREQAGFGTGEGSRGGLGAYWVQRAQCRALAALRDGLPAHHSRVRGIDFVNNGVVILPAIIADDTSCEQRCRQYFANEDGVGLGHFLGFSPKITRTEPNRFEFTDRDTAYTLDVVAKADVNYDGWEDLLVLADKVTLETRFSYTELYVLTRRRPGHVLRVVAPDQFLCRPDYQCSSTESTTDWH